MFEPDTAIIHPRYGAGTIVGMRTLKRGGKLRHYCCIELLDNSSTVLIPAENIEEAGLRLAEVDADMIRQVMDRTPEKLSEQYRMRQASVRSQIDSGEPRQIIQALRDLCWYEQKHRLNTTDTRLKMRAVTLLAEELALRARIDVTAARTRLQGIIGQAMQQHAAG